MVSLGERIRLSCARWPRARALDGDVILTYAQLDGRARRIAATLRRAGDGVLAGVLGARSATVYTGILGALYAGRGYVPVGAELPRPRQRAMIEAADLDAMVVDASGEVALPALVGSRPRTWILPDRDDVSALRARWPEQRFVGIHDLEAAGSGDPAPPGPFAYVLFTSGSTGRPKGVAISHGNVVHFLDAVQDRYGFVPEDRFSQLFALGFDLSVFDLFAAWSVGATVCVPDRQQRMVPAVWIGSAGLTVWFSVPSLAEHLRRLRLLTPGAFAGLRHSLFCGEALPTDLARAWADAAPGAPVDNLYGPTELTLACTWHRLAPEDDGDWVPIGRPIPGSTVRLRSEDRDVAPGEPGQLWVAGPQLAHGYLGDPQQTADRFVDLDGVRHYDTGDRVVDRDGDGVLHFLGRSDHQVKVRGHRIELGEVEAALRGIAGVAAVAFAVPEARPTHLVAVLEIASCDGTVILAAMRQRLPAYLCPRRVVSIAAFPTTANGKVDRGRIRQQILGVAT